MDILKWFRGCFHCRRKDEQRELLRYQPRLVVTKIDGMATQMDEVQSMKTRRIIALRELEPKFDLKLATWWIEAHSTDYGNGPAWQEVRDPCPTILSIWPE